MNTWIYCLISVGAAVYRGSQLKRHYGGDHKNSPGKFSAISGYQRCYMPWLPSRLFSFFIVIFYFFLHFLYILQNLVRVYNIHEKDKLEFAEECDNARQKEGKRGKAKNQPQRAKKDATVQNPRKDSPLWVSPTSRPPFSKIIIIFNDSYDNDNNNNNELCCRHFDKS